MIASYIDISFAKLTPTTSYKTTEEQYSHVFANIQEFPTQVNRGTMHMVLSHNKLRSVKKIIRAHTTKPIAT